MMRDVTPLLRIRAFCPSLERRFVPYNVAIGMNPEDDICHFCMEKYMLEEHGMDADRNMWTERTCAPMDLDREEWVDYYADQMDYMSAISDLLHATNEDWLTDLRDNKMSVSYAIAEDTNNITFRVLYNEQLSDSASNYHPAWAILRKWGVFDLPCGSKVDWVVAYEKEEQSTEDGFKIKTSALYEAHFSKAKE
jgi:hypothetical protein